MQDVLAIILGGGRGERLYPLTKHRAKPALPLAGKYRLIDIPVSNCINSGLLRIYILTQFNSASLNQHIANTYRFSPFMRGFVEVLAAQQTVESPEWYQGTADAVRKTLWVMESWKKEQSLYLILSGDHLYRMDYRPFIEHHRATGADITISVIPVDEQRATGFGIMKVNSSGRVTDFREKPSVEALQEMRIDSTMAGLDAERAKSTPYLASMGIYVFKKELLKDLLERNVTFTDFGKDVIPSAIHTSHVQAYPFQGYWEDIGTIDTFYGANLALVKQPKPSFSFFDSEFPIYARARFLPPSKILDSNVKETLICDGCILKKCTVTNSIIGIRSRLEENTVIENTLVMGADYYQSDIERAADGAAGIPPVGIGPGTVVRNAIVDKNVRIGRNVSIVNKENIFNVQRECEGYWIRNGIVIVMKGAIIPDNSII